MFGFIKQIFIVLLLVLLCFCGSLAAAKTIKCVSVNNQQFMVWSTIIDLNLEELYYYLFIISMNRCDGTCNTIEDPFGRICVPCKMADVNL